MTQPLHPGSFADVVDTSQGDQAHDAIAAVLSVERLGKD